MAWQSEWFVYVYYVCVYVYTYMCTCIHGLEGRVGWGWLGRVSSLCMYIMYVCMCIHICVHVYMDWRGELAGDGLAE